MTRLMPAGALRSLLVEGVIGGVGGVLVFLPQIMMLFFFIAVLEDCGYMARAAYLMDKLMVARRPERQIVHPAAVVVRLRGSGHHGHARDRKPPRPADDDPRRAADELHCPAAGLYAADRRVHPDRSYRPGGLLGLQGLTLFAMYLVGHRGRMVVALVLKRTLLRGPTPPFVMELPSYKMAGLRIVCCGCSSEAGRSFIARAR